MTKLVKRRPVPVHGVEEVIRPWHLHIIARRRIECRGTADAEVGAGRRNQRFCLRKDKPFRDRRWRFADMCGQPVALLNRKDGEPLEEGNRSEEHTSELQSLIRLSYAVFCLKKQKKN